ncbi:MAG: TIR domain-containing protein [Candidatus Rokubacteria bacterium]|nr:TIR domain-containing protein [Candidatus Rokubacteria bacterium]
MDRVPQFDAFISYSSKDHAIALKLAEALARDDVDVFLDSWYLQPGQSIPKVLLAALRKSRTVVACMTPSYFASTWAEFEVSWNFVEVHLARAGAPVPLVPVKLLECEPEGELRNLRWLDLTGDRWDAGYRALVAGLRAVETIVLDAHPVASPGDSREVADFVVRKLQRVFHYPEERTAAIALVLDELVQNAVQHGGKPEQDVRVSGRLEADRLRLEIADRGGGFDLRATLRAAKARLAQDPCMDAGRGLLMVDRVCDELSSAVTRGRHVVTAVIGRSPSRASASRLEEALAPDGPGVSTFVEWRERYVYVRVRMRRVDHADAYQFKLRLANALETVLELPGDAPRRLIIDVSSIEYLGSAALRELALLQKQARAAGIAPVDLVGVGPLLAEVLMISGYARIFRVFARPHEALGRPDQLDYTKSPEVRVGAIYALERIARDSERDHWPIMEGTNLSQAHLEGANLSQAQLEGAYLGGTHLEGANFSSAYLEGADLSRVHLARANLTYAIGLTKQQIESAITDENTKLPYYLAPSARPT